MKQALTVAIVLFLFAVLILNHKTDPVADLSLLYPPRLQKYVQPLDKEEYAEALAIHRMLANATQPKLDALLKRTHEGKGVCKDTFKFKSREAGLFWHNAIFYASELRKTAHSCQLREQWFKEHKSRMLAMIFVQDGKKTFGIKEKLPRSSLPVRTKNWEETLSKYQDIHAYLDTLHKPGNQYRCEQ